MDTLASASGKAKLLVVGQTPPPYHGQAMMINRFIRANIPDLEIHLVRMAFSDSYQAIGRFKVAKLFHIFEILFRALQAKVRFKIHILYYPPAGPHLIPIVRDILVLSALRPFFKKRIYHFRAAGVSEYLRRSNVLIRTLAKIAYGRPDLAIQLSHNNPEDGRYFHAKRTVIIPNGIEDEAAQFLSGGKKGQRACSIIFVGVITETKGVMVLLEAASLLAATRLHFNLNLVGGYSSESFRERVQDFIEAHKLSKYVTYHGVLTGRRKLEQFLASDILCFPTYFESESFGNVLLEAMSFELPIVATRWRGVVDVVQNEETGLLVPVKDPKALAEALRTLILNDGLRRRMGRNGRERFVKEYSLALHLERMRREILAIDRTSELDSPLSISHQSDEVDLKD